MEGSSFGGRSKVINVHLFGTGTANKNYFWGLAGLQIAPFVFSRTAYHISGAKIRLFHHRCRDLILFPTCNISSKRTPFALLSSSLFECIKYSRFERDYGLYLPSPETVAAILNPWLNCLPQNPSFYIIKLEKSL